MKQYKKLCLLLIISIFSFTYSIGQIGKESKGSEIKLQISPLMSGDGLVIESVNDNMWMDNAFGFEVGSNYSMNLSSNLWLSSGISFFHSKNNINIYFREPQSAALNILRLPINVGYNLIDLLRLNGGLSIDYQLNNKEGQYVSNQSGISFNLSPTFIYSISDQFDLHTSLDFSHYSVISFNKDTYKDRIMTYGISVGISMKL